MIRSLLEPRYPRLRELRPLYREFRAGDVRISQADISKAQRLLAYRPAWRVSQGLAQAVEWYAAKLSPPPSIDSAVSEAQAALSGNLL
jgi:UDP-N-acetylglucosamine 4-epimerase